MRFAAALCMTMVSTNVNADVLYCVETASTGFTTNEEPNQYRHAIFTPNRFTLRLDESKAELRQGQGDAEIYQCAITFSYSKPNVRFCYDGSAYTFNIDVNTLKFTKSKSFGYVAGVNDSIVISYGECSAF